MTGHSLTSNELRLLESAKNSETKVVNIRLREGEYQFGLAKAIASFELELCFPDVKDLIKKLYGELRTEDIQFIRKIQTILKKMEKSGIITILPKEKPWELQRYALSSFRFQDIEKNTVVLITDSEMKQILDLVHSSAASECMPKLKPSLSMTKITLLITMVIASYITVLWTLSQPTVSPVIFVLAFSAAVTFSFLLGMFISGRK